MGVKKIMLTDSLQIPKILSHSFPQVVSNAQLFFGDLSFYQELSSIANLAIQILDDVIRQEPNSVSLIQFMISYQAKI